MLIDPCNFNIKSDSFVYTEYILLYINIKRVDGHLVEDNAEQEEDNVEDLVDNHLSKWHKVDIGYVQTKVINVNFLSLTVQTTGRWRVSGIVLQWCETWSNSSIITCGIFPINSPLGWFWSVNRYLSRETDDKEHGAAKEDPVFHQQALHSWN